MGYKDLKGDEKVARPVAISTFKNASITKMCQSVVTDVPFVGKVTLRLTAGDKGTDVKAENLYLDVSELDANAKFENIDIGVAAKDTDNPGMGKGPEVKDKSILPNGFGQQADVATLTNVEQKAWATTAGTFELSGLSMRLHKGDGPKVECY
jgi:hypothetical protein